MPARANCMLRKQDYIPTYLPFIPVCSVGISIPWIPTWMRLKWRIFPAPGQSCLTCWKTWTFSMAACWHPLWANQPIKPWHAVRLLLPCGFSWLIFMLTQKLQFSPAWGSIFPNVILASAWYPFRNPASWAHELHHWAKCDPLARLSQNHHASSHEKKKTSRHQPWKGSTCFIVLRSLSSFSWGKPGMWTFHRVSPQRLLPLDSSWWSSDVESGKLKILH